MRFNIIMFVASGIIAFCLYALLLLVFVGAFHTQPTKYTTLQESAITIQTIDIQAYLDLAPKQEPKAPTTNPLEGSGIKDMFAQIDANSFAKSQEIADDREKYAQNAKKLNELAQQSKDLQQQLHDLNTTITIQNESTQQDDGKYDEWFANISKILLAHWDKRSRFLARDLEGIVVFEINTQGKMHYMVKRYTLDNTFDEALDATLKELETYPFPPPKQSKSFSVSFGSLKSKTR